MTCKSNHYLAGTVKSTGNHAKIIRWMMIGQLLLNTLLVPCASNGQGNFFDDKDMVELMRTSFNQLYNFQFDESLVTISPVRSRYRDYPPVQIFDCLVLYWKFFPVATQPAQYEIYRKSLVKALDHAEEILEKDKENAEKIFYCLLLNTMLAKQNSEDGNTWKAVRHTLNAYNYIKRGFTMQSRFSEFYFTTGLYNYYREFFPQQHPVYRPFLFLFPQGSKTRGLRQLDSATKTTLFVKPEALMFSSYINLRYQDNAVLGLQYAEELHRLYPANHFFTVLYIENLIQSNQFEKALPFIGQLEKTGNDYFRLPFALFKGMVEERYYKRFSEAEKWYLSVIDTNKDPVKANENYVGLAYHGLATIEKARLHNEAANKLFKKACAFCTYVKVKKIACN